MLVLDGNTDPRRKHPLHGVAYAVRKGLVAQAHAWPYQGEIFELPWR